MKPYIPLIIDFLTWGALVPAITWSAGTGMFLTYDDYPYEEFYDPSLWNIVHKIGSLELAGIVFASFVWSVPPTPSKPSSFLTNHDIQGSRSHPLCLRLHCNP